MLTAGLIFAALAAVLHVYIFVMESLTWTSPRTRATFGTTAEEAETTKLLAFNQGFYNLFLGLGVLVGVVGSWRGWDPQGSTLVVYGCLFMIGAALVLVVARPAMARGAAIQGVLPVLALVAAWLLR